MLMSNHAFARFQQRGFSELVLSILDLFGTYEQVPGGALILTMRHKAAGKAIGEINRVAKKLIRAIEKTGTAL